MAGNKYLAGIDIGTTGSKATIFDLNGNALGTAYREYPCLYPKLGWVEQDADLLVSRMMESSKDAIAASGVNPADILSISFSVQRCCTIPLDKDGHIIRPMLSWQDNRTANEVEDIKTKISDDDYFEITGFPNNTTWMLSKMLWLRKNEPQNWEKVHKVVQMHDYTLAKMGANDYFVDYSDARYYGVWDPYKFQWSDKLLKMFDIDKNILPIPAVSGTKAGKVSAAASQMSGFAEGTIICVGAGDQNAAAVGAGVVSKGDVFISMGTSGAAGAYVDHPFKDPNKTTFVTNNAIKDKWLLEGHQAGAAGVYRWFRDEITQLEAAYAHASERDVYQLTNTLVEKTPVGAKGLIFLPYLAGAATPRWNPEARGSLVGLTFAHDRGCVARAFMEGITMDMRDLLQSMINSGVEISNVRILGGPTKSPLWNQIQADIYKRPVGTLKHTDAAVVGAAIIAGFGVGVFDSIAEGVKLMVLPDEKYEPIEKNAIIYDELYDIFCNLYKSLNEQNVFSDLAKLQEKY
jgi:xylulokinase